MADTVTNFAMSVDDEIEQVRKAVTVKDIDSDGVLDWSELRRAVIKLSKKVVRAHRCPQSRHYNSTRQHLVTCSVRRSSRCP